MLFVICLMIYFTIGLMLAESGLKYLRKEYPEIINKLKLAHYAILYCTMMVIWLPMAIEIILTKGFPKDEDV